MTAHDPLQRGGFLLTAEGYRQPQLFVGGACHDDRVAATQQQRQDEC